MRFLEDTGDVDTFETHIGIPAHRRTNPPEMQQVCENDFAETLAQFLDRDIEKRTRTEDQHFPVAGAAIRSLKHQRPAARQVRLPNGLTTPPPGVEALQPPYVSHVPQITRNRSCQIPDPVPHQIIAVS